MPEASVFKQIYDALPPEGQTIFGAIIIAGGAFILLRAWWDGSKKRPELPPIPNLSPPTRDPLVVPNWLMIGPMHDMMQSVHEIAEQSRVQNELKRSELAIMRDMDKAMTDFNRGQDYTHKVLEQIMTNQELNPRHETPSTRPERTKKT